MSIEKCGSFYTPTCDICGEELEAEYDFYDAVSAKKANGWHSRKEEYGWLDICPDCQNNDWDN